MTKFTPSKILNITTPFQAYDLYFCQNALHEF